MLAAGGRPTNLDICRARVCCVFVVGASWGCLEIFFSRLSFLFSFSLSLGWMDGWMTWDFMSFSTEFILYQDDGWVMDDCGQWNHVYD